MPIFRVLRIPPEILRSQFLTWRPPGNRGEEQSWEKDFSLPLPCS
jgi:hypothetical protein